MTTDYFKEHHPHTLSDYMARSIVGFSRSLVTILGKHNFAIRAIIANTVLSSFTMILANRLHHRAVRLPLPERESIEDLLCEASGTHFHIIAIRKFTELSRSMKFVLYIIQSISNCFFRFVSCALPKTAHRTLGYMYEKSITDYSSWIDLIDDGLIPNTTVNQLTIKYWELKENATERDMLCAIREDNAKYRDFEHARAEIHNIKKTSE